MACATVSASGNLIVLAGLAMVLVGLGFKLSLAPFHLWTPDVYEGAPAPVTAFMATVSKGAVLAALLRYFSTVTPDNFLSLRDAFSVAAAASMIAGNLLALRQTNVKRILACSSIAHAGYVAVAFLALGDIAVHAVAFYFAAYFAATLGAFGVISLLSASGAVRERDAIEDYRGLFHTRPVLAGVLALMLLSLAGIPLTAGFLGKVYVFIAGIQAGLWWQTGCLVFASAIGLVYYLRIVAIMTAAPKEKEGCACAMPAISAPAVKVLLALLAVVVLWLGIYPAPLLRIIEGIHLTGL
jgi:NADH-quinone oxidoreductase subunit N